MAEQLLATTVELRLPTRRRDERDDPPAVDPKTGTTAGRQSVSLAADPTSALLRIAKEARSHLGDLLGDLRIGGCDITRFEFHATPHRIELASDLRDRLAASWHERPPR
jgi:hypothetical protein